MKEHETDTVKNNYNFFSLEV